HPPRPGTLRGRALLRRATPPRSGRTPGRSRGRRRTVLQSGRASHRSAWTALRWVGLSARKATSGRVGLLPVAADEVDLALDGAFAARQFLGDLGVRVILESQAGDEPEALAGQRGHQRLVRFGDQHGEVGRGGGLATSSGGAPVPSANGGRSVCCPPRLSVCCRRRSSYALRAVSMTRICQRSSRLSSRSKRSADEKKLLNADRATSSSSAARRAVPRSRVRANSTTRRK